MEQLNFRGFLLPAIKNGDYFMFTIALKFFSYAIDFVTIKNVAVKVNCFSYANSFWNRGRNVKLKCFLIKVLKCILNLPSDTTLM